MIDHWLCPDWPAPRRVRAVSTTRAGGVSQDAYASLNLGDHVGDDPVAVARNRAIVAETLKLESRPLWLKQVHSCDVVSADVAASGAPTADASVSRVVQHPSVVMTADCLPVLLCDELGSVVASAHAGWRGLAGGVLERTVEAMAVDPQSVLAWMGPAIGPEVFEVGDEVKAAFVARVSDAQEAFRPSPGGRWLADIYQLARQRLALAGVQQVFGGGMCTYTDSERFFSYRRENQTGRMASLIWLAE